jgi:hypothetical protein
VKGLAPSEAEKEDAHGVRAGYVGAPVTPGVMAHRRKERERERKKENLWMMVMHRDLLAR